MRTPYKLGQLVWLTHHGGLVRATVEELESDGRHVLVRLVSTGEEVRATYDPIKKQLTSDDGRSRV